MAGGLGFEPRLAESESAVLPLDDPPIRVKRLALRILRTAASLATADLLTLHFARIAGQKARLPQWLAQGFIMPHQRAGNAVTDGAGLAGDAATGNHCGDVETCRHLHQLERLTHDHAAGFAAEKLVQRTGIDGDLAAAGAHVHTGRGRLAAAGAVRSGGG